MKKTLFLILAILFTSYGHARYHFADTQMLKWLNVMNDKALAGDETVCESLSEGMRFQVEQQGLKDVQSHAGGRDDYCRLLQASSAAFKAMQATTRTTITNLTVNRSMFPWVQAEVKYHQITTLSMPGMPVMALESDDVMVIERSFTGLKVSSVKSKGSEHIVY